MNKIDDLPEHIIEAILLMIIKDIKQDKLFQQIYNYLSRNIFESCGEQDIHANKIIISDIFKEYSKLNDAKLFDTLNEILKNGNLPDLDKKIINDKLNKIDPYVFIDGEK